MCQINIFIYKMYVIHIKSISSIYLKFIKFKYIS
ncbi:hypothetical protein ACJIZ3_010974 [Penstemon smallii]|uniref:Uncharacterized protein n=1 Tax=Penstemon smallii TaxID=265156 RepID=A0ABD3UHZ0_9LAMI